MEISGEGNGNPLRYSCLENPVDRGAWWARVHGVKKSQTWLKWLKTNAWIHSLGPWSSAPRPKAETRQRGGQERSSAWTQTSPRGPVLRHTLHLNKTETPAEENLARIKIKPKNKLNLASTRAILHRNLECEVHESRQIGSDHTGDGRVNVNILGIRELKWTGMGELNSDDHYIYYCGQESLRRNGVAIMVNKRVRNAVLGCNLKDYIYSSNSVITFCKLNL